MALTSSNPSPVLLITTVLPFGILTSMPPLKLTGIILYVHRAIKNEATAHTHTAMPSETVTKRVGTRTSKAAPIQKSEKRRAVTKERRIVAIEKEAKRARGVNERMN